MPKYGAGVFHTIVKAEKEIKELFRELSSTARTGPLKNYLFVYHCSGAEGRIRNKLTAATIKKRKGRGNK